jgi:hypothetical protein
LGELRGDLEFLHLETERVRLWSVHPKYLDRAGLTALWRESLLAQKVLDGSTKGYRNHPQLRRFYNHSRPRRAIGKYLVEVWKESKARGYNFNRTMIEVEGPAEKIPLNLGQLRYESDLLCAKLRKRSRVDCRRLCSTDRIEPHPLFRVVEGDVEEWEKIKPGISSAKSNDRS